MTNQDQPILGAHNALTGYKPKHWWGWIAAPFSKCQKGVLADLLNKGCRCFDFRVSFNKKGQLQARHGLTRYGVDVLAKLTFLNSITSIQPVFIRMILERGDKMEDTQAFWYFCTSCQIDYPNLTFFGGVRKKDWKQIFNFQEFSGITEADVTQYVGSMAGDARWYEKICPWAYARRMNATNKLLATEPGRIYLFDFL